MQTYLGWKQVHEICRLFHSLCPNEQNTNLQQLKSFFDTEEQPWNSCRTKTLFRLKYESVEIQLMFGRRMITVTAERDSNVVRKRREFFARSNNNASAPITAENSNRIGFEFSFMQSADLFHCQSST